MTQLILWDSQLGPNTTEPVGGKALGLLHLVALGAKVPPFFVIPVQEIEGPVNPPLRAAIERALERWGPTRVAVRSSGLTEDGALASWAGQFESVIGAIGVDEVLQAVETCWASARSERVLAYAKARGGEVGPLAVVIQQLREGRSSGVVFSKNPDYPDEVLISAGLGLGEGVVQGLSPCDTYRVRGLAILKEIADKDERMSLVNGRPALCPVEEEARRVEALSDASIHAVASWAQEAERARGCAQDLEFTIDDEGLWLLQSRPITVQIPQGKRLLWDNSNIIESYSGVTTPLTFSFASHVYTIVYQLFCQTMGVRDSVIRENQPVFQRMIGLMSGQIYYNLNAWYTVVSLLPGYSFNKEAMETMMGVSEVAADSDTSVDRSRLSAGLELARLGLRLGWRLLWLSRDAERFQARFTQTMTRCSALKLDELESGELLSAYELVERELLWTWSPPLVNDFFCMIFYKLLEKRCQSITADSQTSLHSRLLAGQGLASAAPTEQLFALAQLIRNRDSLLQLFESDDDAVVLDGLLQCADFAARWQHWMARFGDRSPDELKLESLTLADTPEFVVGTLRGILRSGDRVDSLNVGGVGRAQAEAEADSLLTTRLERWVFHFVLNQTRLTVARRESLRFERTRVFGFVRRVFRAFGARYAEAGHLERADDVFYLTVEEVLGFTRGTTSTTHLKALVSLRRAEFAGFSEAPALSSRFYSWGAVHIANRFSGVLRAAAVSDADHLVGTPCSPGVFSAAACRVTDPRARPDLKGGILVAHRTDPGWVPLFATASAVLVERGSLLSHSAVVAREFGLPAIVGLPGLMDWVQDGERLSVDGGTGEVRRDND